MRDQIGKNKKIPKNEKHLDLISNKQVAARSINH